MRARVVHPRMHVRTCIHYQPGSSVAAGMTAIPGGRYSLECVILHDSSLTTHPWVACMVGAGWRSVIT